MARRKLLKDPKAIALLQAAEKTLKTYVAYVYRQYPHRENYRVREGRAALREVRGLRMEEQDGWIE